MAYDRGMVTASLSWALYGSRRGSTTTPRSDPPLCFVGAYDYFDSHLPSISYLDVVDWNVWKSLKSGRHQQRARQRSPARDFRDHRRRAANNVLTYDQLGARYSWHSRQSSERLPESTRGPSPWIHECKRALLCYAPSVIPEVVVRGQIERAP